MLDILKTIKFKSSLEILLNKEKHELIYKMLINK